MKFLGWGLVRAGEPLVVLFARLVEGKPDILGWVVPLNWIGKHRMGVFRVFDGRSIPFVHLMRVLSRWLDRLIANPGLRAVSMQKTGHRMRFEDQGDDAEKKDDTDEGY